jgi:hypothetical protein
MLLFQKRKKKIVLEFLVAGAVKSTVLFIVMLTNVIQTPWPESTSDLYRPNDRRLPAKLIPNFADRECNVVSVMAVFFLAF